MEEIMGADTGDATLTYIRWSSGMTGQAVDVEYRGVIYRNVKAKQCGGFFEIEFETSPGLKIKEHILASQILASA